MCYFLRDCFELCFEKEVIDKCSCYFRSNLPKRSFEVKPCTMLNETECSYRIYTEVFENIEKFCDQFCPLECDSLSYSMQTSFSEYPLDYETNDLLHNSFIRRKYPQLTKERLKKRMLSLNVFYLDLKYTEINQVLKYSVWDLIAGIGGSLGLFIGASLLSFLEVIEISFAIISLCIRSVRS